MSRITITLSAESEENMKRIQKMLSEELGGARVMPGYAIGYALKKCIESGSFMENDKANEDK